MSIFSILRRLLPLLVILVVLAGPPPTLAAPEGTLTFAMHFSPVTRWLDPGEGESVITAFLLYYAMHDALVKPLPGAPSAPSLAESWTAARDALSVEFTLRPGIKFHNNEAVTAEDVKFSYDRYRGAAAKTFKDNVKDVVVLAPNRVRFVFKQPWPDFMAFYGTLAATPGWVVPKKYVERVGEEGFRKAPIGAGPYKFVSFNPGVELVLEAFEGYWRKVPNIKRLVFRNLPDETARAAALKSGEVDSAFLLSGPTGEDIKSTRDSVSSRPFRQSSGSTSTTVGSEVAVGRSPGSSGRGTLDRSPGAQPGRRRSACHGWSGTSCRDEYEFALPIEPTPYDRRARRSCSPRRASQRVRRGRVHALPPVQLDGRGRSRDG